MNATVIAKLTHALVGYALSLTVLVVNGDLLLAALAAFVAGGIHEVLLEAPGNDWGKARDMLYTMAGSVLAALVYIFLK